MTNSTKVTRQELQRRRKDAMPQHIYLDPLDCIQLKPKTKTHRRYLCSLGKPQRFLAGAHGSHDRPPEL